MGHKIDDVYPAVYTRDWTKLNRTAHVRLDRERSNRMLQIKRDDYVTLALKVIERDKWYLLLNSGATLVVNSRSIITVLTNRMKFNHRVRVHWDVHKEDIGVGV